jgi:hypothetical protein
MALSTIFPLYHNRIDGAMVSMLASSVVDRGFEPRSGHIKDYNEKCIKIYGLQIFKKMSSFALCSESVDDIMFCYGIEVIRNFFDI